MVKIDLNYFDKLNMKKNIRNPIGVTKRKLQHAISATLAPNSRASKKVKDLAWRLHKCISTLSSDYEDPKMRSEVREISNILGREPGAENIVADYKKLPSKQRKKTSEYMYVLFRLFTQLK